jgi:hypothetical protein
MTDTPSKPKFDSTHDARIGRQLIRYGLQRNVPAEKDGQPCKIAMVVVERENGQLTTLAVNEELIKFMGEAVIEQEIARAIR